MSMTLLPCATDKCQACAVDHTIDEPHNQQSLYYQYWFYGQTGRWPTWADAIAHCSPKVRKLWKQALTEKNVWNQPKRSEGKPIAHAMGAPAAQSGEGKP